MIDLPENPDEWPQDPFEVLNLSRSTDAKTARRAYFRRVRQYKPDQKPVEFQKIREAFDAIENWLKLDFDSQTEVEREGSIQDGVALASDLFHADEMSGYSTQYVWTGAVPTRMESDSLDAFHEKIASGKFGEAVSLIDQMRDSPDSFQSAKANLIRYYLQRFLDDSNPSDRLHCNAEEPDGNLIESSGSARIAWLVAAMEDHSLDAHAFEQLRQEFDRDYRLAHCRPFEEFLKRCSHSRQLVALYGLRWEAMGHFNATAVVDDVELLKPRSLEFGDSGATWTDLLAASLNYTAWQEDQRCCRHSRQSWKEISESDDGWMADSVETLMLAAQQWRRMRGLGEWTSAIPWARNTLPGRVREIWTPFAKSIAADPVGSLIVLTDQFQKHSIVMSLFEEGLQRLSSLSAPTGSTRDWDETRRLVAGFFTNPRRARYSNNRAPLLDFCVINQIDPMLFAQAANSFQDAKSTIRWTDLVQKDGPLRCVYDASHAVGI